MQFRIHALRRHEHQSRFRGLIGDDQPFGDIDDMTEGGAAELVLGALLALFGGVQAVERLDRKPRVDRDRPGRMRETDKAVRLAIVRQHRAHFIGVRRQRVAHDVGKLDDGSSRTGSPLRQRALKVGDLRPQRFHVDRRSR